MEGAMPVGMEVAMEVAMEVVMPVGTPVGTPVVTPVGVVVETQAAATTSQGNVTPSGSPHPWTRPRGQSALGAGLAPVSW